MGSKKPETVTAFNSFKQFCYKGEQRHGEVAGGEQRRWKRISEYFFFLFKKGEMIASPYANGNDPVERKTLKMHKNC